MTSYYIQPSPCKSCELFIGAAAEANKVLKIEVLQKSLLQKYTEQQIMNMKIKQLEVIIGEPDKSWTVNSIGGGQVWMFFYYLWRLSADGYHVFVVDNHHPARDWQPDDDPGVGKYAIVSMGPDCVISATEPLSK